MDLLTRMPKLSGLPIPALRHSLELLAYAGAGFALPAACWGVTPLMLAPGLAAVSGPGGIAACLGALAGILVFQGPSPALLLSVALTGIVSRLLNQAKPWAKPCLCALAVGLFSLIFLPNPAAPSDYFQAVFQMAVSAGSCLLFSAGRTVWTDGLLVLALCQILLGKWLNPGLLACGFLAGRCGLPAALAAGLAVDISGISPVTLLPSACLSAVSGPFFRKFRCGLPALLSLFWMFFTQKFDIVVLLNLTLGGAVGMLLPQAQPDSLAHRLNQAASTLDYLRLTVDEPVATPEPEQALLRQYQRKMAEARRALANQYGFLAQYLRELPSHAAAAPAARYRVRVCAASQPDRQHSGDRYAHFRGPDEKYFVILCDGMGTGPEAAQAGEEALQLLSALVKAGLNPAFALECLNDLYVLRETGGFSTVDLLEIRLDNGLATLYKWGGAPSYLRMGTLVRTIGTGAPPPGLEPGCRAQVAQIPLHPGAMVILLTDGVPNPLLSSRIATPGITPEELADSLLLTGSQDDQTALIAVLEP